MEPFATLAFLLLPEDGGAAAHAGRGWWLGELPAGSSVVWGREPWPPETPILRAAVSAVARERALMAVQRRPPSGASLWGIHRWPPPGHRHGLVADRARAVLLGGAVAELVRRPAPRVIDLCVRAAGATGPLRDIRPVSAGAVIGRTMAREGTRAVLRGTLRDGPGDPLRATGALERLSATTWPFLPRSLGSGHVGDAVWALESELPGRRPSRLTPSLMAELLSFCASLPLGERSAGVGPAIDTIASTFPRWADRLRRLGRGLEEQAARMPSIVCHGDLWAGNLLATRGRLTGLIDWDAWDPSGIPGTDLLHLYGTDLAGRKGQQLGHVWRTRPWRSPFFRSWTEPYWRALGVQPDGELLDAVGLGWWASRVSYRLGVRPSLAKDHRWVTGTIERVLDALEG
jgi:hypothetical protein